MGMATIENRVVILDIGNTLTNSEKQVIRRTVEELRQIPALSVSVVLAWHPAVLFAAFRRLYRRCSSINAADIFSALTVDIW